ncbi:hypothetical protein Ciccas_008057 [Cichlidogyrus casuarinus]|uniref:Uncharacterized protein n=1 Tax=Cichlidogyrus casuarinus TaxID=1844966 RepID=A0ABD2Q572_9PLAT
MPSAMVTLIFDATRQDQPFLGQGYVLPGTIGETPNGIQAFPAIFNYPYDRHPSAEELRVVINLLPDQKAYKKSEEEYNSSIRHFDASLGKSFVVIRIEYSILLLLSIASSVPITESPNYQIVTNFLKTLSRGLRMIELIENLRKHIYN